MIQAVSEPLTPNLTAENRARPKKRVDENSSLCAEFGTTSVVRFLVATLLSQSVKFGLFFAGLSAVLDLTNTLARLDQSELSERLDTAFSDLAQQEVSENAQRVSNAIFKDSIVVQKAGDLNPILS